MDYKSRRNPIHKRYGQTNIQPLGGIEKMNKNLDIHEKMKYVMNMSFQCQYMDNVNLDNINCPLRELYKKDMYNRLRVVKEMNNSELDKIISRYNSCSGRLR